MKKILCLGPIILLLILISGCTSSEKNVYEIFENTASQEGTFQEQQKPIKDLEVKEKALFDQIMELGMKEFDEVNRLTDDALANLDQREEYLLKEKESIEKAKEEFDKAESEISKIKDEKIKKQADTVRKTMNDRFNHYQSLFDAYLNGLKEDRKIYEMLKNQDLEMEDLQEQIEKSNKAYEIVVEENNKFNDKTEELNKEKKNFYEKAGIEIKEES